jgi:hypothetical protein
MPTFRIDEFKSLVQEFLNGNKTWDDVHQLVINAEWENAADLPPSMPEAYREAVEELQMAFLADSKDDPQFLPSKPEVAALLQKLETLQNS